MNLPQTHWDKIRPQFDALPYPNRSLEESPRDNPDYLALHNCTISHYLREHRVIDPAGKWILDAGCGSGYKLLALAIANPGATIVGVDISPRSLEMAQQRLKYHQIDNPSHFHCLAIEELSDLPYRFDYINCDDVLYLLADPVAGLRAMKSVLKPDGIIRANMHSVLQRSSYLRVQQFLTRLGCMEEAPAADEIAVTRQMMATLQDWVETKRQTWSAECEKNDEIVLMNHLLSGDTGITMADFSAMVRGAELEFISMVNWRQWNLENLFKSLEELPVTVALSLAEMGIEQQLYVFELLQPIHRLLDLYCGHPGQGQQRSPVGEWDDSLWQQAKVYIHPQLNTEAFRQALKIGAEQLGLIPFHQYLRLDNQPISVESSFANCLYALLNGPQTVPALQERWLKVRPFDLLTLEPTSSLQAFQTIRNFLLSLEQAGYVMLEIPLN
ncbi:MAG: class I SAM-dependent methyltransferase [Cyanobacteria bacterium P01_C01_bin.120]